MWFRKEVDLKYCQAVYLQSVQRLRDRLNEVDANSPLLQDDDGCHRPAKRQRGVTVGPITKAQIAEGILGLATKHQFEYRVPDRNLDYWIREDSVADELDPESDLFAEQLCDSNNKTVMLRRDPDGCIKIRSVFTMTLACAFTQFHDCASAKTILEQYLSWPIVHTKKPRQKPGAGSALKNRRRQKILQHAKKSLKKRNARSANKTHQEPRAGSANASRWRRSSSPEKPRAGSANKTHQEPRAGSANASRWRRSSSHEKPRAGSANASCWRSNSDHSWSSPKWWSNSDHSWSEKWRNRIDDGVSDHSWSCGKWGGDWNEECNSPSGEEMGSSHDPTPAASATDNGGARLATKSESPAPELQCDSSSRSGSSDDRPWRRERDRRRSPSPPRLAKKSEPPAPDEPEHKLGRIPLAASKFGFRPAARRRRSPTRSTPQPAEPERRSPSRPAKKTRSRNKIVGGTESKAWD